MDAIVKVVKILRTKSAIAFALGITPQAISKWKGGVPSDQVLKIAQACAWQVTPHELRPDLYPHPEDGLPAERRGNSVEAAA